MTFTVREGINSEGVNNQMSTVYSQKKKKRERQEWQQCECGKQQNNTTHSINSVTRQQIKLSNTHSDRYEEGEIAKPWLKKCTLIEIKLGHDENTGGNYHAGILERQNDFRQKST